MTRPRVSSGHNGGPPLDAETHNGPPMPRCCKYCRHWSAPSDREVRDYETWRLGISRRRVKRPSGACDRVLIQLGKSLAFSATVDTFGGLNFSAKLAAAITCGHGFVTVYEGDRIVWRGHEEDVPDQDL